METEEESVEALKTIKKTTNCAVDLPYPTVHVAQTNRRYAKILMNLSSGKASEMDALSQYMFQHITIEDVNEEIAVAMKCIAIVEMKHFEMLGDVIHKLGEQPRYGSYNGAEFNYWTGRHVDYTEKIKELLLRDISDEKLAISAYKAAIAVINDEQITALLRRIILDEEEHLIILNKLYRKYV